ncbi:hypothetical protein PSQ19_11510 [Devosia algicola]|uniref:MarR family transcriptional regulator n=1 Tax=Devosia algicola TaxID=3026418 RepID=A0ABY7YK25_9HYPH|nr:hypothetical protein [Devosia algicola]WDR01434.1 hypothetical protein PSQ19_11510 [Devosia algicola]
MSQQQIDDFIEMMGLITQTDGGPRIAGRIFGLLLIEGGPMTLQAMADRLKISKASASTNARLLADRSVVRLTSRPGERQDLYEIEPNPYQNMIEGLSAGYRKTAKKLVDAERAFPENMTDAKTRIRELSHFYETTVEMLDELAKRFPEQG